ncbi:DUF5134 domain-containing protein [Qaidamihabitans albus]|uniref:DUF5134 domain-containing protein n=1 Tax=Qaidamihabitans albus TaxID=2795733 RepID=UPI0018F1F1E5|nr:DUF5134 domain-containing protein [Qaidamihabitans albus]
MHIPVVVAWILTGAFLLLSVPCLSRLVRLDYPRLGSGLRQVDLAGLLMALAMVAMASPVGAPVPTAGWQALFLLTGAWFLAAALWRRAPAWQGVCRRCHLHHAVASLGMLYMLAAMPHDEAGHGPWPAMSTADASVTLAWPVVAALAAVYFAVDGTHSAVRAFRAARTDGMATMPAGFASRTVCRTVMGLGMGYMFATGL